MSMSLRRKAVIPVWIVLLGLLAVYLSPLTVGTGGILLLVGILVPTVVFILWQEPIPTKR